MYIRVAIDVLDYAYNHDPRTRWPRLSAGRLQIAVDGRGLGPRDLEVFQEQRTQRPSFVAIRIMQEYTQSSSSSAGLGCFVEKKHHVNRLGTYLRG